MCTFSAIYIRSNLSSDVNHLALPRPLLGNADQENESRNQPDLCGLNLKPFFRFFKNMSLWFLQIIPGQPGYGLMWKFGKQIQH